MMTRKKMAILALAAVMIPQTVLAARPVEVFINGRDVSEPTNPMAPIIRTNRSYLPLRAVLEDMGFKVDWSEKARKVTVKDGNNTIVMTVDRKDYKVNEKAKSMDVAPFIEKNHTYVPLRFMAEGMGMKVDWDEARRMVVVGDYATKTNLNEKDRIKGEDYSYILPEEIKDRLVIRRLNHVEAFYDKLNFTDFKGEDYLAAYGRIGEIRVVKDPVEEHIPMILLNKVDGGYRVFTYSSDLQVKDINDKDLEKSYNKSKMDVETILKTYRAE